MAKLKISANVSNRAAAVGKWEEAEVSSLQSAARRTRTHPAHTRHAVEASIRQYGVLDPVTINSSNVIVDGHLRVDIARKLGFRTVPVIRIAHLSDTELRAYAIAANKLPAVANYDLDELRIELEEIRADLPAMDLTLTGFTIGEIDRIGGNHAAGLYDDLDEPEPPRSSAAAVARQGDLYALGDHRLICGDSLDPHLIAKLMGGDVAACCFTDPPFNVKINGDVSGTGRHAEFAIASGEMTRAEFEAFLITSLSNAARVLADGAIAFVCMDHAHIGELLLAGDMVFDDRLNICVWAKGRGGIRSLWRSQHELIAVFKKGTAAHINTVELGRHGQPHEPLVLPRRRRVRPRQEGARTSPNR